jgi:hypothetical protein
MKKVLSILVIAIALGSMAMQPKIDYSRVYTVNGVDAYIMSEPVREYEIVLGKDKPLNILSVLTGGLVNNNIKTKVSALVNALMKKAEEDGVQIDAVIYTSGKAITGIKYTDQKTDENDRKAEVQKMSGIPLYIMADPYEDYKVVSDEGGGIKWKSLVTAGLINNSIEEDISKYVGKFEKKYRNGKIDAILYNGGKEAMGIKFQTE